MSVAVQAGPARGDPPAPALVHAIELAHDLRTPLSSMLVITELLEQGRFGALPSEAREQVRVLHAAVRSLCAVTDDVLALARSEGADAAGPTEPLVVATLLETVADAARPMATARGLALEVACTVEGVRRGQARAIERVLLNLVTNALKFTPDGMVELSAHAAADASTVTFMVQDAGPGLVRGGDGGTGMGLRICRRLLDAMGSTLRVDAREAGGSRFAFDVRLSFAHD